MTLRLANITFDCVDAAAVGRFWSEVLGRPLEPDASEHVALLPPPPDQPGVPTFLFLQVPEPRTAKNRVHVDLVADDRAAEVARAVALGATHVHDEVEYGISWSTLRDPEGNELCIADAAGH
jgi:catechol 2,3-dioxygenase-like lactoylglutathione lyase family enzyme